MKTAMTALAVALLAGAAAPALAQDGGGRRDRGDAAQAGHSYRDWGRDRREGGAGQAPQVRQAPPAPAAPQAPAAAEPRRSFGPGADRRDWNGRGDNARRGGGDARDGAARDGGRRDWGRRDDPRPDVRGGDGRRDGHQAWNGSGGRQWGGRDRNGRDGRGWDGRDNDRRDWDRRDGDRRDWDRRDGDRRDWDRRGGDHRRWERGRYPSVYASAHRYRHAWRPPTGFYVRSWGYGDVLPRGWFAPSYWIDDVWQFDLPLPPPGYAWVRSGDDALLVDQYSGRIVQVVRDLFW